MILTFTLIQQHHTAPIFFLLLVFFLRRLLLGVIIACERVRRGTAGYATLASCTWPTQITSFVIITVTTVSHLLCTLLHVTKRVNPF